MRRNRTPMMILVALAVPAVLMALNILWSGSDYHEDAERAVVAYDPRLRGGRTTGSIARAESDPGQVPGQPRPAGLYYTYRHPDYYAYQQCGRVYCVPALRGDHYPAKPADGIVVLGSGVVEGPIDTQGRQVYR